MTREHHEPDDPLWTHDVLLHDQILLRDGLRLEPKSVRLKLHVSDETYPRNHGHTEILPISDEPGKRRYVMAHAYLLVPAITLQIGVYPEPSVTGAIGEVTSSSWEGMRHLQIGSAQAWYYPSDHTIILWELLLYGHLRPAGVPPSEDQAFLTLWRGFEAQLCSLFLDATQIGTPSWDPECPREEWYRMLETLGYTSATPQAFVKTLPAPNE